MSREDAGLKKFTPRGIPSGVPTIASLTKDGTMTYAQAVDARKSAIKNLSIPKVGALDAVNADNIAQTTLDLIKKQTEDAKSGLLDETEQKRKTTEDSFNIIKAYLTDSEGGIQTELKDYQTELQTAQTGFESNRMNQVRSQIIQSLAARGIDVSTVPPEQLIALSGEVGVSAFNDVYEKKTAMQARIRDAKDKALTQMRELRGKKALNEDEYKKAVTDLNVAESTKRRELDTAFNNAFLGLADSSITRKDTAQTQALNVLNTIGIAPSKLGGLLTKVQ